MANHDYASPGAAVAGRCRRTPIEPGGLVTRLRTAMGNTGLRPSTRQLTPFSGFDRHLPNQCLTKQVQHLCPLSEITHELGYGSRQICLNPSFEPRTCPPCTGEDRSKSSAIVLVSAETVLAKCKPRISSLPFMLDSTF